MYTEEYHFSGIDDNIKELYQTLKARILDLGDNIQIKTNKRYIAFRLRHNFAAIKIRKSKLNLILNIKKGEINDPLNKARALKGVLSEVHIKEPNEIQYALPPVQQSFNRSLTS